MSSQRKKGKQRAIPTTSSSTSNQPGVTPSATHGRSADSTKYEEATEWSLLVANVTRDVSDATELLAPLKSTMALLIRGLEITRSLNETKTAWKELEEELSQQLQQITDWASQLERSNRETNPEAKIALQRYSDSLQEIKKEIDNVAAGSKSGLLTKWKRIATVKLEQDAILKLIKRIDGTFRRFSDAMNLVLSRQISGLSHQVSELRSELQQYQALSSIKRVDYGTVDSFLHLSYGRDLELCEQGTRREILEVIRQWASDTTSRKSIFWLRDAAGTGKSTVAATMADEWLRSKRLAARFFFSPNSTATSILNHFCTALAKDMAVQMPSLATSINTAIQQSPVTHFNFPQQFDRFILEPLQKDPPTVPLYMVIDAVDNCDPKGRAMLLEFLVTRLPSVSNLKALVTSRPLSDIEAILRTSDTVQGRDVALLDKGDKTYHDIQVYVNKRLPKLTAEQRETIITHSEGLFLWASTACRMLQRSRRPAELMTQLLSAKTAGHLDELYLEALRQAVVDRDAHDLMMNVLQFVIAAFQPISISTIEAFLPHNTKVDEFVQDLGGLLKDGHPERPIFVIHGTFREFISQAKRANGFLIDLPSSHGSLAIACVDFLDRLERDMLQVDRNCGMAPRNVDILNSGTVISEKIDTPTKYASSYWAHHASVAESSSELWNRILHFLNGKLLQWVELMSWRGNISACVAGLSYLHSKSRSDRGSKISFLTDSSYMKVKHAYQFVAQNQRLLQDSALQAYVSALAFSPEDSPLLRPYKIKYQSTMPDVISSTPTHWPEGETLPNRSPLLQVEFTSDTSRLITRTITGSLQLWNTESHSLVAVMDGNASDFVEHFSVSSSRKHLAFCTRSKLYMWNLDNGAMACPSVRISGTVINQVIFLPTAPLIIFAVREPRSGQDFLRGWDTNSGEVNAPNLPLNGSFRRFAVSHDAKRLACICGIDSSGLKQVTLWSLESYEVIIQYTIPQAIDTGVTFDMVGTYFVSWDDKETLNLRQSTSGEHVSDLHTHHKHLSGALFSPKGTHMASYDKYDPDIVLWDLRLTECFIILRGHTLGILFLCFSFDGERIASVSSDQTVRVWHVDTGAELQSFFQGYTGRITHPVLSQDWSKLVTVTSNHQLNLYDTGDFVKGEEIYEASANFEAPLFAFSPSNDILVSGNSYSPILEIWSLDTAKRFEDALSGHTAGISSIAFSPDGKNVASGSWDTTVRLWDPYTRVPVGRPMQAHKGKVICVAYSPDSRYLASICQQFIQVWDARDITNVWSLAITRKDLLFDIAFSPNSTEIAGFLGLELCVWTLTGGEKRRPVDYGFAEGLSFSPAGQYLASVHLMCIALWAVDQEISPVMMLDVGREFYRLKSRREYKLGISLDGSNLVYGHRMWDISSLPPKRLENGEIPSLIQMETSYSHSLLVYIDGWIHHPKGPVLPIPDYLQERFQSWGAAGNKMVIWTRFNTPMVIDCTRILLASTSSRRLEKRKEAVTSPIIYPTIATLF